MSQINTSNYGWKSNETPHTHGYLGPAVINILAANNIRSVVDLGCGNGDLCSQMRDVCTTVVGIENDLAGYQLAQQSNPDLRFYHLGVQDSCAPVLADFPQFDAAVSTEVIEHLYSPHQLPEFAAQVLKPGGLLIVTTPYHGYFKNLALAIFNKWDSHHSPLWHGGHIKFWSRATLTKLLEQNGFEVTSFAGVGRFKWLWKSMIVVAKLAD